jgi:mRNA-degrading endonuclease toxin of MazEF toxin-antitoxin module
MRRGELWFAATAGGDRPVLVLTRDPVADRIGAVVVAALTRTRRGLVSELELTAADDLVPTDCVVNFRQPSYVAAQRVPAQDYPVVSNSSPPSLPYASGCHRMLKPPNRVGARGVCESYFAVILPI